MRLFTAALLLWAFACAQIAVATPDSPDDPSTKIPNCALKCVAELLSSTTSMTCVGLDCVCNDPALEAKSEACVLSACTLLESLNVKRFTEKACGRVPRDKSTAYDYINIVSGTVGALIVLIRVVYKRFFSYAAKLDSGDWVILSSLILGIPSTIINSVGLTPNGLGKDVWAVPPGQLPKFALFFYLQEIIYFVLTTTIKVSLALFYLTIFPSSSVRRVLWMTIAANLVLGVAFLFTGIFQCTPVNFYWDQYGGQTQGHCVNINMVAWVNGALNVAMDVWMLSIPVTQLRKLKINRRKKIAVAIMFLTGAVATVVSILRLQSLVSFANSKNPTWDQWTTAFWSTLEVNIGSICTSLPTLRVMFSRAIAVGMGRSRYTMTTDSPSMPSVATKGIRDSVSVVTMQAHASHRQSNLRPEQATELSRIDETRSQRMSQSSRSRISEEIKRHPGHDDSSSDGEDCERRTSEDVSSKIGLAIS
ncbi:hypothetical protein HIM_05290 [Hirsutella minnesotensis 3608]|uniref:Uncharacterized protein n=1 Tax=Hirsutella minnesotensis 3608 TaxID=1043627 RepID=A0A0F8A5I0_9HYPO|nr:hypothetical protein HIM_05290 [Hirsutella minnesotensis 3608]